MVAKKKNDEVKSRSVPKIDDCKDSIAVELKKAREARGLSFSELHALTGLSRTTLHQYEAGTRKPGTRELIKLCEALKVSPNRLLFGSETQFESPGVLMALVAMATDRPERAAVLTAVLMPIITAILSKVGRETLVALATIADETLRARDPETFAKLQVLVAELRGIDAHELMVMSQEDQERIMRGAFNRAGFA